jgi:hypothetical protein
MRPEPILTPDAHADVLYAAELYATKQSSLGTAFLEEFERMPRVKLDPEPSSGSLPELRR